MPNTLPNTQTYSLNRLASVMFQCQKRLSMNRNSSSSLIPNQGSGRIQGHQAEGAQNIRATGGYY